MVVSRNCILFKEHLMPLSFGVPLGVILAAAGVLLLFATKHKQIGRILLGIGAALILVTLILIMLAAGAQM